MTGNLPLQEIISKAYNGKVKNNDYIDSHDLTQRKTQHKKNRKLRSKSSLFLVRNEIKGDTFGCRV